MDYNQVVKKVEVKTFCNSDLLSRKVQELNVEGDIIRESLYVLYREEEYLKQFTEWEYDSNRRKITEHKKEDISYCGLDKTEIRKAYEYDAQNRIVRTNVVEKRNDNPENRKYTIYTFSNHGIETGETYSENGQLNATEHYDENGNLVQKDNYLGAYLFSTDFLVYDPAGNLLERRCRYEESPSPLCKNYKTGIIFTNNKYEYDKNGNKIAEFSFLNYGETPLQEVYSTYNEKNELIKTTTRFFRDGIVSERSSEFTYETTVHEAQEGKLIDQVTVELLAKANSDNIDAMMEVARNYYNGKCGFEQDDTKAFYWAQKVVKLAPDWPSGWDLLARCYSFGVGTDEDHDKAVNAWQKAAELGDADSMFALAEELFFSNNPSEQAKSVPWLDRAISCGNLAAMQLRGQMYLDGKCSERDIRKGFNLLERAADGGDAESARLLGEYYQNEKYIPMDSSKSGYYYTRSVDLGEDNIKSIYYAGLAWFHGIGVEKDFQKARHCFEQVHYLNDADAIMGCMCFEGIGGSVDRVEGENRLRQAISGSDTTIALKAKNSLGMYLYSDDNRLNDAIELLCDAADSGFCDAQVNLGKAFYEGRGVEQNIDKAVYYWELAAKNGSQIAANNLQAIGRNPSTGPTKKSFLRNIFSRLSS